jgi:hypothetical protein
VSSQPLQRQTARRELLAWVASLGAVNAPALAMRSGCPPGVARARLLAGARAGLLASWCLLRGEPALYTLTRAGLAQAGRPEILRPTRVSVAAARHSGACCAVAAALERAFPAHHVIGEPLLGAGRLPAPSARGDGAAIFAGERMTHRPDLLLVPARTGELRPIAIEVELTVKAPRRLRRICAAWARERGLAGVLYVTAGPVHEPLLRAIAAVGAEGRVLTIPLEQLLEPSPRAAIARAIAIAA